MIPVDLERNTTVDLLDSREADAVAAWLTDNPGVEVIARDRSEPFADGARRGAPRAVQVVERWHLLKNVGDLLERLLHQHRPAIEAATRAAVSSPSEVPPSMPTPSTSSEDRGALQVGAAPPATVGGRTPRLPPIPSSNFQELRDHAAAHAGARAVDLSEAGYWMSDAAR